MKKIRLIVAQMVATEQADKTLKLTADAFNITKATLNPEIPNIYVAIYE